MTVNLTLCGIRRSVAIIGAICAIESPCAATSWRFVPGDAYFRAELTHEVVAEICKDENDSIALRYCNPRSFEESLGYAKLEIIDMPQSRRQLLAAIYKTIRKTQPMVCEIKVSNTGEVRSEINGMTMLVYNRDFDYKKYSVGLRYNENWMDESAVFGLPRSMVDYAIEGDQTRGYIVEDWRNSKPVAPLKVTIPKHPDRWPHQLQFNAMTINSKDVILILVASGDLEAARFGESEVGFYVVEENRSMRVRYAKSDWISEVIDADTEDAAPASK